MGGTAGGYETVTGQFAIGTKLCVEPRVDALLTVVYAYLEKGKVTQAISGPYDLGRPKGCKPDKYSKYSRFDPAPLTEKTQAARKGKKGAKKSRKQTSKEK